MEKRTITISRLLAVAVITVSAVARLAHADPERDPAIRQELSGAEVPDHIVFGVHVADLRDSQRKQPDIAWQIVEQEMHLNSEDAARAFLARMVTAADELDQAYNQAYRELLCGEDSPRSQANMRAALDTMDDLYEAVDHNVYTKFVSGLNDQQARQFDAWLEDLKEGMTHTKLNHDRVFGPEDDVVGLVDMNCAQLRRTES